MVQLSPLIVIAVGVLSGVIVGMVGGVTVLAWKYPKSYKKLYGVLLIILLGALVAGAFWDLINGAGYSRFVITAAIVYVSFLRALPLFLRKGKLVKEEDDK